MGGRKEIAFMAGDMWISFYSIAYEFERRVGHEKDGWAINAGVQFLLP